MILKCLVLTSLCGLIQASGVAQVAPAPVVTASSSQYFERTFNRLVAAPVFQPVQPVVQVAHPPQVFVEPVTKTVPVNSVNAVNPTQNAPFDPHVAIAIATAQAAPVATILLPPYPFGPPPTLGFIPPTPPINVPDENTKEETTQRTTISVQTTLRQPEQTTPIPSNSDNSFVQSLPSNQNTNFKQYQAPPVLLPLQPQVNAKPQKLKTLVEVVPVPLTYITPPPLRLGALKTPHLHTFAPKAKIVLRPATRVRTIRVPAKLIVYKEPILVRTVVPPHQHLRRSGPGAPEPTTFSPLNRPNTKPPRL